MSEKQNMLESRPYNAAHPELKQERLRARKLLWQLNRSNPEDEAERAQILHELLPNAAQDLHLEPPFFVITAPKFTPGKMYLSILTAPFWIAPKWK